MPAFRKKPVVIAAEQWWPGKKVAGVEYPAPDRPSSLIGEYGFIQTLEGGMYATPGDWIITGVKGEIYACKPDIFEATYEAV